jgi:pimeloyl-ACP methyl ester carboxylesterase
MFTPSHRGGSGPPLVLLHGFTGTWRAWDLVLPQLERHHDVLAPTLPGHAGGPPLADELSAALLPDAVERAMDEAGFETAHIAGNSLGGYVALQLAARGRAESVVAFAPGGGWEPGDETLEPQLRDYFVTTQEQVRTVVPHAEALLARTEGRRRATRDITTNFEHIPSELLVHLMLGIAQCRPSGPIMDYALRAGYPLDAARITCPVRIVWGTEDQLLPWPSAAVRYRRDLLPHADWIELEGIGHCPQLDVPSEAAALILGFPS